MSETTQGPTHFRLMSKLKAIGPYLREPQSQERRYYFDCLSVCVDDKKNRLRSVNFGAGGWIWNPSREALLLNIILASTTKKGNGYLKPFPKKSGRGSVSHAEHIPSKAG